MNNKSLLSVGAASLVVLFAAGLICCESSGSENGTSTGTGGNSSGGAMGQQGGVGVMAGQGGAAGSGLVSDMSGGTGGLEAPAPGGRGGAEMGGTGGTDPVGGAGGTQPSASRTRDGLVALYTFEGSGATARDVSGVEPALDLNLYGSGLSRIPGGIKFSGTDNPIAVSSGPARKIIEGVKQENQITVEIWMKSTQSCQKGPARLFSLAKRNHRRNLSLLNGPAACGDHGSGDIFQVRLKNAGEDNGCDPTVFQGKLDLPSVDQGGCNKAPGNDLSVTVDALQHIVFTQDSQGVQRFYNNGKSTTSDQDQEKSFDHWYADTPLGLGNEPNDGNDANSRDAGRKWLGELYMVAVFKRALSAAEVQSHFDAGHAAQ